MHVASLTLKRVSVKVNICLLQIHFSVDTVRQLLLKKKIISQGGALC